jgi:hypothetical protein
MSCEFRILDFNYAWQDGTAIAATSTDPQFPVSNLKNQIRAFAWRSTSTTAQALVFDLKTTEAIDSVVLLFDPFVGNKLSSAAIVKIQASHTNFWGAPPIDQVLTIDETNGVASHYFTSDQSYRYWRLYIDDPVSGYSYIEVSKLFLAKATQLTQGPDRGFSYSVADQSKNQRNDYGHEYSDIYPNRKSLDLDYTALTLADQESLLNIFERLGSVRALLVDIDSTSEIFDKDRFFIYGKLKGQIQSKHKVFSYFDSGIAVEETM